MRVYAPGIAQIFDRIYPDFYTEREEESVKKLFPTAESISIDYAVMEKAEEIYVLPAQIGWSDLGTLIVFGLRFVSAMGCVYP